MAIITPWVDIIAGRLSNSNCALLMTNNTTSKGWLKKTNFIKDREDPIQATIRIEVARLHATYTYCVGFGSIANGSTAPRIWSQMPSPGTTTPPMKINQHPLYPLPLSASTALQNCSSTQQDNLVADLASALAARETAVGQKTHENEARVWDQHTKWCEQCGLGNNLFLNGLSRQHKIEIMGAFAVAICEGWISRQSNDPLAQKSVSDTLNFVAATFREHGCKDPKKDIDNNIARLLRRQLRSYKKDNPKSVKQKAHPLCIIRLILSNRMTELQ